MSVRRGERQQARDIHSLLSIHPPLFTPLHSVQLSHERCTARLLCGVTSSSCWSLNAMKQCWLVSNAADVTASALSFTSTSTDTVNVQIRPLDVQVNVALFYAELRIDCHPRRCQPDAIISAHDKGAGKSSASHRNTHHNISSSLLKEGSTSVEVAGGHMSS